MNSVAFAAPILPGKLDAWREAMSKCQAGNPEYEQSRKQMGIERETCWLQQTPAGDVGVVYLEAADLETMFRGFATSQDPFDRWFRDAIEDVHGFDLADPGTPPELMVDFSRS